MADAAPGWRTRLRKGLAGAMATGPVYAALRARALRGRPVTVLCYHTLGPDDGATCAWTVLRRRDFADQIAHLQRHYRIVSLDEALAAGPGPGSGGKPLAVVTFDDGEAGLSRHLLPVLDETPIPVTVYIATEQIETGRPYWFDRVMTVLGGQGAAEIDLESAGRFTVSGEGRDRWPAVSAVLEAIKAASPEMRDRLAARVEDQAPAVQGPPLQPMTRSQLTALADHPCVTIGGHSHCHHLLDRIPLAEAAASIQRCRDLLRDWTGQEVQHFAYPNGNWTEALAHAVSAVGFHSATVLGETLWRAGADAYALPRIGIGRHDGLARFKLRLAEI